MNDFPWTPQHGQPSDEVETQAVTEEVVLDSDDQAVVSEEVVDKPVATKPAAKKATSKTRVTNAKQKKATP